MKFSQIQKKYEDNKPFVSVVTPTYNRRKFIPQLLKYYRHQTYPKDKLEFIILDDGTEPIEDLILADTQGLNIRYCRLSDKTPIGQKRNILNDLALGEYIICMDDDDYYPPDRVSHAVKMMYFNQTSLAGSSLLYIYFINDNCIKVCGPYMENHGTNGTFAYSKEYSNNNRYQADKNKAEETSFTNMYKSKMVQLNSMSTIICVAHDSNTVDKTVCQSRLVTNDPSSILSSDILDFYKRCISSKPVVNDYQKIIEV